MASKQVLSLFVLLLSVSTGYGAATGDVTTASPVASDDQKPAEDPLQAGMEPFYKLTESFLVAVAGEDWAKGMEKLGWLGNGTFHSDKAAQEIATKWQQILLLFVGFASCVVVGILYCLCCPFVGCIVGCCRCCGNCGGKRQRPQATSRAAKMGCSFLLGLFVTIAALGVILSFLSTEMIHRQSDGRFVKSLITEVGSFNSYLVKTSSEISTNIAGNSAKAVNSLVDGVDKLPVTSSRKMTTGSIVVYAQLEQAKKLAQSVEVIEKQLDQYNTVRTTVTAGMTAFNDSLVKTAGETSTTLAGCSVSSCVDAKTDLTQVYLKVKFGDLPDLYASYYSKIKEVVDANLSGLVLIDMIEFDKIADRAKQNKSQDNADLRKETDNMLTSLNEQVNDSTRQMDSLNLKSVDQWLNRESNDVDNFGDYYYYAMMGLCGLLALVVFLFYVGIFFGICGEMPSSDARACNKGVGANFLMAGSGCSVLFAWFFMIITLLLFIVGSVTFTQVCLPMRNPEKSGMVAMTSNFIKQAMGGNSSISFDLKNILTRCKENKGIYSALELDKVLKIDESIDLDKYKIKDEVSDIGDVSVMTSDIDIFSDATKVQLNKVKDILLDDIKFDDILGELGGKLTATDLKPLIERLKTISATSPAGVDKTALAKNIADLEALLNGDVKTFDANKAKLHAAVTEMKTNVEENDKNKKGFKVETTDLITRLADGKEFVKANGTAEMRRQSIIEANRLQTALQSQLTSSITDLAQNVGKCRPAYDFIVNTFDTVCNGFISPMNTLWFGFGTVLAFLVVIFITSMVVSALYRETPDENEDGHKSFEEPQFSTFHKGQRHNSFEYRSSQNTPPQTQKGGYQNNGYHASPPDYGHHQNSGGHHGYHGGSQGYQYNTGAPPNPPHYYGNR